MTAICMASIGGMLSGQKYSPLLPSLMNEFQMSYIAAGLLISCAIVGSLGLTIPSGFVIARFGPKKIILISLLVSVIGSIVGAIAIAASSMYISRILEGSAGAVASLCGMTLITLWFRQEMGFAMGIWGTLPSIGTMLSMNLTAIISTAFGWRAMWWFTAAAAAASAVIFFFIKEKPPAQTTREIVFTAASEKKSVWQIIKNADLWLAAIPMWGNFVSMIGGVSWTPTFLVKVRGMPMTEASLLASLLLGTGLANPLAGKISDHFNRRKWCCALPLIPLTLGWVLIPYLTGSSLVALILITGLLSNFVVAPTYAAIPEVTGPERASLGLAIAQTLYSTGSLLGPWLFAFVLEATGSWTNAFLSIALTCPVGLLVLFAKIR